MPTRLEFHITAAASGLEIRYGFPLIRRWAAFIADDALDLIRQAIEEESDDSGWAPLSAVGSYVQRIRANFDARLYGSKKLSDLLRKFPNDFDIEERGTAGSSSKTVFVRKPARKTSGPNGRLRCRSHRQLQPRHPQHRHKRGQARISRRREGTIPPCNPPLDSM